MALCFIEQNTRKRFSGDEADYDDIYCEMKTSIGINGYNKELVSNYSKPEKVFMIYSIYGTVGLPIIYDNYVLINYGFDTE